jgi:enoyl-CoA hydratase/carnithine racemase
MSTATANHSESDTRLVRSERVGDHVVVVTLADPPTNTISAESRPQLIETFRALQADESVRCVVLTGAGHVFSAGGNLREDQVMTPEEVKQLSIEGHETFAAIEGLRVPVIGAINGPATGGGFELTLACDIRIASENAYFVASGVNVGLIVSFWRLPRVVGVGVAKEILLTGERVTARQAQEWGLVTGVHAPEDLLPAALAKAQRIASRAPLSVEASKAGLTRAFEMDADEGTELQTSSFLRLHATDDHQEALRAFFSRTEAVYQRR